VTLRDRLYAFGWSALSFGLCIVGYGYPPQRYFDEVYYPRSAAEYLHWQPQYEWTHPPLTKLIVALSMLMFGDNSYGWRFLNIVIGAATVYLLYVFAKRLTASTPFANVAALLLVFDGFHYTQSRIATPEITVAFISLLILYTFYRYWCDVDAAADAPAPPWIWPVLAGAVSLLLGAALSYAVIGAWAHQSRAAVLLMWAFITLSAYAGARTCIAPRPPALRTMWVLAFACGLGAAAKWNDLFDVVLVLVLAFGISLVNRRVKFDAFAAIVLSGTIAVYLASYIPFFLTPHPATFENGHDLSALMDLQNQMFTYHDVTVTHNAPHPYSSKWWEWPLLFQPVAYWYQDLRHGSHGPNACCVAEILSLPNPLSWWFGLVSVPLLGVRAFVRRSRGALLLIAAYFAQWLPWIASPRMLFEYHFFPNDAIIVLADAFALQWIWEAAGRTAEARETARIGIALVLGATMIVFAFFYPILAGVHITYGQWSARMWLGHWIIGPG
jgi:dolichyl-phosphate-mannose-protein mannosyltransferase